MDGYNNIIIDYADVILAPLGSAGEKIPMSGSLGLLACTLQSWRPAGRPFNCCCGNVHTLMLFVVYVSLCLSEAKA